MADGTPTEEEFASWDEYGRFVVTDQDDKSQEVKKGDRYDMAALFCSFPI